MRVINGLPDDGNCCAGLRVLGDAEALREFHAGESPYGICFSLLTFAEGGGTA